METDLRTIGLNCALIRTLICMVLLFFPFAGTGFSYSGATGVSWYGSLSDMILAGVATLFILMIITFNWAWALKGGPFRGIKEFCSQSIDPEATLSQLERIWNEETFQNQNCRINEDYLIWARKLQSLVIPVKDIYGINYVDGPLWISGTLTIYLKNNTVITLSLSYKQGNRIVQYIEQHIKRIVIGESASSERLSVLVGKVNARYQIIKIHSKYYIIDYANPNRLCSYLSFDEKYRFNTSKPKEFWRAWEISEQELQNIKYIPHQSIKMQSRYIQSLLFGVGIVGGISLVRSPLTYVFPVNDFFGGQGWIAFLTVVIAVLICLLHIHVMSRLDTTNYTEVYISRNEASYTQSQLFQYVIARIVSLVIILYFLVNMFFWNIGLFPYILYVCFLLSWLFIGFWSGSPNINPQSTIQSAEEVNREQNNE